jgi:hypothetical protein
MSHELYVSGPKGAGLLTPKRGNGAGIIHNGQSSYSIGLEWMWFRICVIEANTSSKGLTLNRAAI